MIFGKNQFKKIKGDASFRVFYRKKNIKKTSIVIYAKKEKKKNLLIYDAINKILIKNKILAPRLYSEQYKNNFIEIEDFGDETVLSLLKNKKSKKIDLYKKSINVLNKIQKIKQSKIKNFNHKEYKVPLYEKSILLSEVKLFLDWYAKKYISKKNMAEFNFQFNKYIKILIAKLKFKNNIFVHRDFHVSNLMKYKGNICVIDTQDALIGNRAYDLASLIDDVRYKTNKKFKDEIYNYYINLNKKNLNKEIFLQDFEILSVIRNIKIIGIFTRLAVRDNKKKYLKLIPYAWKLIELRIKKNLIFNDLKKELDINFSKKIRYQK